MDTLTPFQPLYCALRHSKELPPFGNFSKAPVMVFEAAIKISVFLSSSSFFFFCQAECSAGLGDFSSVSCMHERKKDREKHKDTEGSHNQRERKCVFFSSFIYFISTLRSLPYSCPPLCSQFLFRGVLVFT